MLSPGFEPTIPSSERRQTHALDRAATGIGFIHLHIYIYLLIYYVSTTLSVPHSTHCCVIRQLVRFFFFKFCVSVHHSIRLNKTPTWCNKMQIFIIADFLYMFRASCAHHQEYKILTKAATSTGSYGSRWILTSHLAKWGSTCYMMPETCRESLQ